MSRQAGNRLFGWSIASWLHTSIAPTSTTSICVCVCGARNQLKSTFYFYDCTFLRTRAKFILFHVVVCFFACWFGICYFGGIEANAQTNTCTTQQRERESYTNALILTRLIAKRQRIFMIISIACALILIFTHAHIQKKRKQRDERDRVKEKKGGKNEWN